MMLVARLLLFRRARSAILILRLTTVNSKTKLALGVLTALAMLLLTFALPRGSALRDSQLVLFPVTVGVWAIFVLLFVKLK
jgi:hypothetical protein